MGREDGPIPSGDPRLRLGERKLAVAASVGAAVLLAQPLLRKIKTRHLNHEGINDENTRQLLGLQKALLQYTEEFPNPLYGVYTNRWPLILCAETLERAMKYRWFGASDVYDFLDEISNTLLHEFNIPHLASYPDSLPELMDLVGVPEEFPGVRFLPGYRRLKWHPHDPNGHQLIFDSDYGFDFITLQKTNGRSFILGSSHALYGLEPAFEKSEKPIIRAVQSATLQLTSPYVIFDRDGTLTTQIDPYEHPEKFRAFIQARGTMLQTLQTHNIPFGLWTRADPGDAEFWAKQRKEQDGVDSFPNYDFGHWPILELGKNTRVLPVETMLARIRQLPDTVQNVFAHFLQATFGNSDIQRFVTLTHQILDTFMTDSIRDSSGRIITQPYLLYALEAKLPVFAALFDPDPKLTAEMRIVLIQGGILVNDATESLTTTLPYGCSFIYIHNTTKLQTISNLILRLSGSNPI